ncbi:MAG: hypothetical protein AAF723_07145, partial [Pseudomonadota bacterium]
MGPMVLGAFLFLAGGIALSPQDLSPRDQYNAYYLGSYAPKGQCTSVDQLWTFEKRTISEGRLACDINDILEQEGGLVIKTKDCSLNGQPQDLMTYTLDLTS